MNEDEPADDSPADEPKKHVTVNDEPEVFTIRPDTLEVERQERPKPTSTFDTLEELTEDDVAEIIDQTLEIINICEEKVMNQKVNVAKLGFMVIRISESIKDYEDYIKLLDKSVVIGDDMVSQHFEDNIRFPCFKDCLNVFEEGLDEKDLRLVKEIQENRYTGGMLLKSFKVLNKSVSNYIGERRRAIEQIQKKVGIWINLQNSLSDHLDHLKDTLYKLSVHIDILKSGESRIKLAPDEVFADTIGGDSILNVIPGLPGRNFGYSTAEPSKAATRKHVTFDESMFTDVESFTFNDNRASPGNNNFRILD